MVRTRSTASLTPHRNALPCAICHLPFPTPPACVPRVSAVPACASRPGRRRSRTQCSPNGPACSRLSPFSASLASLRFLSVHPELADIALGTRLAGTLALPTNQFRRVQLGRLCRPRAPFHNNNKQQTTNNKQQTTNNNNNNRK